MLRPIAVAVAALTSLAASAQEIETPDYEVVASATFDGETVEARRYAPMIVAEVTVEAADREAASSKGFMPLAGYIFGQNRSGDEVAMTAPVTTEPAEGGLPSGPGEKIAMTAPVTTEPSAGGRYAVRFMMPSRYTMETLPEPSNENVALKEIGERNLIATGFTGPRTREAVEAAATRLNAFLSDNGLEADGDYATAGFDGPDVPENERRWEVQQPVRSLGPLKN